MSTHASRQHDESTLEDIDHLDEGDIKNLKRLGVNPDNINDFNSLPYLTSDNKKDLINFIETSWNNLKRNVDINDIVESLLIDVNNITKKPTIFTDRNTQSRNIFKTIVDNYTHTMHQMMLQQMKDARIKKDRFDNRKSDTPAIHQSSLLHLLRGNKYKKRSRKSRHLRGGSKKIKRRSSNKSRQRRHKTKRK